MATKTRKPIKKRKPAGPKQRVVRPVTIAMNGSRRRIVPNRAEIIEGTDGLLAVTKHCRFSFWEVTHVLTGYAFIPGPFKTRKEALRVGMRIFEAFPKTRLRQTAVRRVVKGWTTKRLLTAIGAV